MYCYAQEMLTLIINIKVGLSTLCKFYVTKECFLIGSSNNNKTDHGQEGRIGEGVIRGGALVRE
jgi:hypothetical protein